nr:MAG TPA: hypothetical protein [Caudoviricetes sp.]
MPGNVYKVSANGGFVRKNSANRYKMSRKRTKRSEK